MRVFVLTTGRSGSKTFAETCKHLKDYTAGHETNKRKLGEHRFDYPDDHVEVDCRLAWFLGVLNLRYPDDVYYVHLKRDVDDVAKSWLKRWSRKGSMFRGYVNHIKMTDPKIHNQDVTMIQYAYEMIYTINANITDFLKDKKYIEFWIDRPGVNMVFDRFCKEIDSKYHMAQAFTEIRVRHNKTLETS